MGNTYKRNSQYRPKKHGQVFNKDDKSWKKSKPKNKSDNNQLNMTSDIIEFPEIDS